MTEPTPDGSITQRTDGGYATADLVKDAWTLGVVQSRVHPAADEAEQEANLAHMLHLIDNSFHTGFGFAPDLLFFHEFPISGWDQWTKEETERRCIEIPGPETERISAKAREYGCHIAFGAYVRDPDWPGHVLSITTLIGPDGEIIAKHWKARNVKGVFRGFELFTTTTYDVLDQYVEMYGADAVLPVARTGLGNISMSSTQLEPELFRALAIKGAEVFLRTASGSFSEVDIRASALHNRVYCAIVNNSVLARESNYFEDTGAGGSAVYGPDGQALATADSKFEKLISAQIPIASFRAVHRQPDIHWDLYRPVFEQYRSRFEPNLYTPYQPHDLRDAGRYLNGRSRWR
ncbi:nitrilase-related carbon-nitrogen hydrolase [Actinomadura chokoriensis]|uniref:Nitrilase-related carbon-nitrogen hydrolase n=1 Tax=Actinomadura chokoriensis TaxID=454156 RepID=A0ABV4R3C3_9ACTN